MTQIQHLGHVYVHLRDGRTVSLALKKSSDGGGVIDWTQVMSLRVV